MGRSAQIVLAMLFVAAIVMLGLFSIGLYEVKHQIAESVGWH